MDYSRTRYRYVLNCKVRGSVGEGALNWQIRAQPVPQQRQGHRWQERVGVAQRLRNGGDGQRRD